VSIFFRRPMDQIDQIELANPPDNAAPLGCLACGTFFTPGSQYLDAGNKNCWHEQCYMCQFCSEPFTDSPVMELERLFHDDCSLAALDHCRRCKEPVESTDISMSGFRWHFRCFQCALCHESLDPDSAVFRFGDCYHEFCVVPVVPERGYFLPDDSVCHSAMTAIFPGSRPVLLSKRPLVLLLPHFLTSEECAYLREAARVNLEPSQTGIQQSLNPSTHYDAGRTSSSAFLDKGTDAVFESVERRAAAVVGVPYEHVSRPHIGHYSPGEQFAVHWDAHTKEVADADVHGFNRLRTVLIYLNSPAGVKLPHLEGPDSVNCPSPASGHTQFPLLGLSVAPTEGCAILFQNIDDNGERIPEAVHAGLPVCCGEKWIMNLWCYNKPLFEGMVPHYFTPE